MPKSFSESERAYIKQRLIEEAQNCLSRYGLRKTTVDEIVKRVKIPKGTFYLFYESKEMLLFDVFIGFHDRIHSVLLERIGQMDDDVSQKEVTTLIFDLYKEVEGSFMFRMLLDGDIERLFRKLPPKALLAHNIKDDLNIQRVIAMVPGIGEEDTAAYSAAFRAVFASLMYRREVGEAIFDKALWIMIHGIVLQLFKGAEK